METKNFAAFYAKLQTGSLPGLSYKEYLLSKDSAETIWNNWFGHLVKTYRYNNSQELVFNEHLHGITPEACAQLLKYSKQFQYGLDLNHLPAGFTLLSDPGTRDFVLHYDKKLVLTKKSDRLAPLLQEYCIKKST
jgi:hypothetical protein